MALTTTITANSGATGNYVTVAGAPPQTVGLTLCMWIAMPFDSMQNIGNSTLDTPEIYMFRVHTGGWPRMDFACLGQRGATNPVFRMQVFSSGPDHDTGLQWPTDILAPVTNGGHTGMTWVFAAFTWNAATGSTTMYCAELGGSLTTVATENLGTHAEIGVDLDQIDICSLTDNSSFTGSIWGAKTFAAVLTPTQLQDEAASATPVATAWNHLTLNTGAGRLSDATGNGHPGTAVGTLTDGIEEPALIVGNGGSGTAAFSRFAADGAAARTGRGIRYIGAGSTIYSAASGTSVAPTYPASLAAGDMLILTIGMKPTTANGGTVTTPTGWTLRASLTGAGGYGATLAADTGNTNIYVYTKDTVAGTESGALTVTVGVNNVCWGTIHAFRCGSRQWSVVGVTGSDTVAGDVSCTFGSDPGVTAYDAVFAAMCIPTDVTTPSQFSAETFTQTGVTYGGAFEISEPDSTTGNDIGGLICWCAANAGTSSAAPVFAATAGGTNTNVRGPLAFLRLRELGVDGLADHHFSSFTASGTGSVSASGITGTGSFAFMSLTLSGAGLETFTGTGTAALKSHTAAGSGLETVTGTGTAALKSHAAAGSGLETFTGSGSATFAALACSGTGGQAAGIAGSGSASFAPFACAGAGSEAFSGTGTAALKQLAAAGSGLETFAGSGSASFSQLACSGTGSQAAGIAGSGTASFASFACTGAGAEAFSGTGTAALRQLAAAGSGLETFAGSGTAALRQLTAAGSGLETFTGTGTALFSSFSVAGSGLESFSGSGSAAFASITLTGAGSQASGIVGSGTLALRSFAASGSGSESFVGSGSATLTSFAASGTGVFLLSVSGSGSAALQSLSALGAGLETFFGSGSAALQRLSALGAASLLFSGSGTAALRPFAASGSGGTAYFGSGAVDLSPLSVSGLGHRIAPAVSGSGGMQLASFAVHGSGFIGVVGPGTSYRESLGYGTVVRLVVGYGSIERATEAYGTIVRVRAL